MTCDCKLYVDGRCTNPQTYVNVFGEPVCGKREDAIRVPDAHMPSELELFLDVQREWSRKTFGDSPRTTGILKHIELELDEIRAKPTDISEWIDVVILALDGAWRVGYSSQEIVTALYAKQRTLLTRNYPPPDQQTDDKPIEHIRTIK